MNKEDSPGAVLEEAGIAFDPGTQNLDLSKEEKRRCTALMLAIQAYDKLIIKDAEYLREMYTQRRQDQTVPAIRTATIDAMLDAAVRFDDFIVGKLAEKERLD
jgi:hypothetical protein